MPRMLEGYSVEFDTDGIPVWGKDIVICDIADDRIGVQGDSSFFIGLLDFVDYDGEAAGIRLGDNTILLQASGTPFEPGTRVKLTAQKITLYDEHI